MNLKELFETFNNEIQSQKDNINDAIKNVSLLNDSIVDIELNKALDKNCIDSKGEQNYHFVESTYGDENNFSLSGYLRHDMPNYTDISFGLSITIFKYTTDNLSNSMYIIKPAIDMGYLGDDDYHMNINQMCTTSLEPDVHMLKPSEYYDIIEKNYKNKNKAIYNYLHPDWASVIEYKVGRGKGYYLVNTIDGFKKLLKFIFEKYWNFTNMYEKRYIQLHQNGVENFKLP